MTLHFNKFSRIVAMAVLAGVMVPNVCLAGKQGGGNNGSHSMKSSGNQFRSLSSKSTGNFNSNGSSFKSFNTSSMNSPQKFTQSINKPIGSFKSSGNLQSSGKVNTNLNNNGFKLKSRDQVQVNGGSIMTKRPDYNRGPIKNQIDFKGGPLVTANPGKIDYNGTPLVQEKPFIQSPVGPLVEKKPFIKSPIGPLVDTGNGKPIDGGIGNGNPGNPGSNNNGNHNCNNNNNCNYHKCPWPIFWPIYGGGNYWNSPCYYGPTCATPTVIINDVPPVVINEVVPVSAEVAAPAAVGTNVVDLVLEDVQYVEPATLLVGPAYRVKFRNQGLVDAGKFRVALIAAVDGQANEQSPQAMVEVAGLASGQSSEVTVRLPRSAMQLVNSTGESTAFTHLLVAADFDNLVSESDKANNVAIIDRTQLEVPTK